MSKKSRQGPMATTSMIKRYYQELTNERARRWTALLARVAIAAPAEARRDRTVNGDVIKAARFLSSARIDDARDAARRSAEARARHDRGQLAERRARVPERRLQRRAQGARQSPRRRARRHGRPDPQARAVDARRHRVVHRDQVARRRATSSSATRPAPTPRSPSSRASRSMLRGRRSAMTSACKPADPIRVELLGAPADLAKRVAADRDRDRDDRHDRAVEVQQADGGVAARDAVRLSVDGHARARVHAPDRRRGSRTTRCRSGCRRASRGSSRRAGAGRPRSCCRDRAGAAHRGLRKGRLITFDEMHPSMAKLPSQEAAALAYAEVYTLVGWMQQKIGYKGHPRHARRAARRQERAARGRRGDEPAVAGGREGVARAPQGRRRQGARAASRSSSARAAPTPRTSGSRRSRCARASTRGSAACCARAACSRRRRSSTKKRSRSGGGRDAVRRRQARAHARRARPV